MFLQHLFSVVDKDLYLNLRKQQKQVNNNVFFIHLHVASLTLVKYLRQTIRILIIKLFIDKSTLLTITTCVTIMLARVVLFNGKTIINHSTN